MTVQTLERISTLEAEINFRAPSELQPLVQSLRSILKQIDEEYERERDKLNQTLPNTSAGDRALAMLQVRHCARRENYVLELATLVEQTQ
jgi:hypothetical protein